MSRRTSHKPREVFPDPVYGNKLVSRFIARLMLDGKKGKAEKIFYNAMAIIKEKTQKEGLEVLKTAYENVAPQIEVRSRRVGGATYQVPMEVEPRRQQSLTLRWLVTYARERNERTMALKFASELIDASNNTGGAIKKKEDVFRMAEANKAFVHYRW